MRVVVEGSIGAGKTTFLNRLKGEFGGLPGRIFPEPVDKWENFCGFNLLKLMYENPHTYGSAFQMYALLTHVQTLKHIGNAKLAIFERSMLSQKYIFLPMMRAFGLIPDAACSVFDSWFDFFIDLFEFKADVIIYIKTSAHVTAQRIADRGRQGEEELDFNRLLTLQNGYHRWITELIDSGEAREFKLPICLNWFTKRMIRGSRKTIILTINGDLTGDELEIEYQTCFKQLRKLFRIYNVRLV